MSEPPPSPDPMSTAALPLAPAMDVDLRTRAVELMAREEGILRQVLGRYLRSASAIDDGYQEVGLRVLRSAHTVRDPAALRGWLFQTARNVALDQLRRDTRRPGAGEDAAKELPARGDQAREPADALLSAERIAAVRRALDQLPASQREAILLFAEEGLDHEGIAQRLGLKRNAVEVRLCRARTTLRERLADIFGGDL